ncbi:MAG: hypothetical protein D8M57_05940 [Candidatus Scalindua sp. AMX11]|nr:MAG: hypothetical protein DWQ00_12890 [Candidatus Scalindua sp.]RZV86223.1 MAG: hypothetical protein EX341_07605 [Candidatus Scalindua sp. SCAELEC01]TDE65844.1 MAG: hypothetical protein D8M57_05940 [Candidatus Scalindua sp. AMX11]GJQ58352.1 MAG: hypothetical protein SCALA701_11530 [Candidatus Scalindua sp.]
MKRELLRTLFSILFIGTCLVLFARLGISQEGEATAVMKGTIVTVDVDAGTIVIEDEVGNVLSLTVESWIDLTAFSDGDKVIFEYSYQGVIRSMNKIE